MVKRRQKKLCERSDRGPARRRANSSSTAPPATHHHPGSPPSPGNRGGAAAPGAAAAAASGPAEGNVFAWHQGDASSTSSGSSSSGSEEDNDREEEAASKEEDAGVASETECIELLSDEDDDVDVIEILSSDLEDDEGGVLEMHSGPRPTQQAVTYQQDPAAADPLQPVRSPLYQLGRLAPLGSRPAAAAAAAQGAAASQHAAAAARATPKLENSPPPSKKQRRCSVLDLCGTSLPSKKQRRCSVLDLCNTSPPRKSQRRCSVLDLCGSQLQTYHEELPAQRHVYNAYVDGSHRQKPWPAAVSMSAGGFLRGPPGVYGPRDFFDFSLLLVGGPPGSWLSDPPGSMISEMGAIWIGCGRLQKAIAAGSIVTSTSQVHMHTDCQQAANLLKRKGVRLPPKLVPLIAGIKARLRDLKQHMPVRLKWVKGHQKGAPTEHGSGNNEAHKRAQANRLDGVEQLPTGPRGDVVVDETALAAAWVQFIRQRAVWAAASTAQRAGKKWKGLNKQMKISKRKGWSPAKPPAKPAATAAQKAAARQQARLRAQGRDGAPEVLLGAAAAAAAAAAPPPGVFGQLQLQLQLQPQPPPGRPAAAAGAAALARLQAQGRDGAGQVLLGAAAAAAAAAPPPAVFGQLQLQPPPPPARPAAAAGAAALTKLQLQKVIHTARAAATTALTSQFGLHVPPPPPPAPLAAAAAAGPQPPRPMVRVAPRGGGVRSAAGLAPGPSLSGLPALPLGSLLLVAPSGQPLPPGVLVSGPTAAGPQPAPQQAAFVPAPPAPPTSPAPPPPAASPAPPLPTSPPPPLPTSPVAAAAASPLSVGATAPAERVLPICIDC